MANDFDRLMAIQQRKRDAVKNENVDYAAIVANKNNNIEDITINSTNATTKFSGKNNTAERVEEQNQNDVAAMEKRVADALKKNDDSPFNTSDALTNAANPLNTSMPLTITEPGSYMGNEGAMTEPNFIIPGSPEANILKPTVDRRGRSSDPTRYQRVQEQEALRIKALEEFKKNNNITTNRRGGYSSNQKALINQFKEQYDADQLAGAPGIVISEQEDANPNIFEQQRLDYEAITPGAKEIREKQEVRRGMTVAEIITESEEASAAANAISDSEEAAAELVENEDVQKEVEDKLGRKILKALFQLAMAKLAGVPMRQALGAYAEMEEEALEAQADLDIATAKANKMSPAAMAAFLNNSPNNKSLWGYTKGKDGKTVQTFNLHNFKKRMESMNVPKGQWQGYMDDMKSKKTLSNIKLSDDQKKADNEVYKGMRRDLIHKDDDRKYHAGFTDLRTQFIDAGLIMDNSKEGVRNRLSFEKAITDWMRDYKDWEKNGRESWNYHGTSYAADEGYEIQSPVPYFWKTVGLMTDTRNGIKPIGASEADNFDIKNITAIKTTMSVLYPSKADQVKFQIDTRRKWMEGANKNEEKDSKKDGYHYDDFLFSELNKTHMSRKK